MAEEKAPVEFEAVLKGEAKKYNLAEDKLREEIGKELYARVAREIVEKIIAGEVEALPRRKAPPYELTW